MKEKIISGFSKLSKLEKLRWVVENFFRDPENVIRELMSFWHKNEEQQRVLDGFSENTISNFYLPYGVAPNFIINGKPYVIPMVTEESSVVAAVSKAAKFWMKRGGFKAEIISTTKVGQIHFCWKGEFAELADQFEGIRELMRSDATPITANMEKRGGGVLDIELVDMTHLEKDYFQVRVTFETCDSMGANFINSVLESFGRSLKNYVVQHPGFSPEKRKLEVVMAILSNYTPECLVRASVECKITELEGFGEFDAAALAERFRKAVRIAHIDEYRATTHNKGIFNGIDAVVLATGNDFRAIEACGHAYAARDGQYRSLSYCEIEDGVFRFWLDLPVAVGTVGGLTKLHPIARKSLEMLGDPTAKELMMIIAVTGLAQNFGALRSLITTGIQQGHMKMHLVNILNHLNATEAEVMEAIAHFSDKVVSFNAVRDFLQYNRV